jgi:endonuclease/exonuclease/phosphatase family metal-dependent hydrolase
MRSLTPSAVRLGLLLAALALAGCQAPAPTSNDPPLFGVLNHVWKGEKGGVGSHHYRGRDFLFDQIVVSPGMLDQSGWRVDPDSGAIVKEIADRKGRPLPFGDGKDKVPFAARGASDHFPVTVRLHVEGGPQEGYLFCFWNVENFFDDVNDGRKNKPDQQYDRYFGDSREAFRHKVDHLRKVILGMNGGKGPDILALAEVETQRAAEKLREALNAELDRPLHYQAPVFLDPKGGRRIATAVITRLQPVRKRAQLLGKRLRILQVPIEAHGHQLVVVASHWTSRVSDKEGKGRKKYADLIYGRFKAMYLNNPEVDFLACGDFNDNPNDPSVTDSLHVRDLPGK